VDCVGQATRLDQVVCSDVEAKRLAARVDDLFAAMKGDPSVVRANQADWKQSLPLACAQLDHPESTPSMDLDECLRLVLRHRIEVLEGGHLYRGEGLSTQSLPNPTGNLPTTRRRRYTYFVTSPLLHYLFELLGDHYLSNSEMVVTRLRGVFKLAYAGILPNFGDAQSQSPSDPDRPLFGGRVYRVLNLPEVRAQNPATSRSDEQFWDGLCTGRGQELRWIVVNDDAEGLWLGNVVVHDYMDLMTRGYGLCGTQFLHLNSTVQ
jgi:hypothetical protein